MSPEDALKQVVLEYGADEMAARLGVAPSTLRNTLDPKQETHSLSFRRFRQLLHFAADKAHVDAKQPLHALCAEFGGVFVDVTGFEDTADKALLENFTQTAKEFGDMSGVLHQALSDGRITRAECEQVSAEVYQLTRSAAALSLRVASLCEPDGEGRV